MTQVITLKVTDPELDVLDWLVKRLQLDSRSEALRVSMLEVAEQQGLQRGQLHEVEQKRRELKPRRSPKLISSMGRRPRKGRSNKGPS